MTAVTQPHTQTSYELHSSAGILYTDVLAAAHARLQSLRREGATKLRLVEVVETTKELPLPATKATRAKASKASKNGKPKKLAKTKVGQKTH